MLDYITGQRIIEETDRKPGPWMGKLVREAALLQDNDRFANAEEAYTWMRKRLAESPEDES